MLISQERNIFSLDVSKEEIEKELISVKKSRRTSSKKILVSFLEIRKMIEDFSGEEKKELLGEMKNLFNCSFEKIYSFSDPQREEHQRRIIKIKEGLKNKKDVKVICYFIRLVSHEVESY